MHRFIVPLERLLQQASAFSELPTKAKATREQAEQLPLMSELLPLRVAAIISSAFVIVPLHSSQAAASSLK
jgi:hypothetical protein